MSSPAVARPRRFDQQATFVYVKDLAESCKFYEGVLGLRPVLDQVPPGEQKAVVRILEVTPTAYLGLCERDPKSLQGTDVAADGVILCMVTDQVDSWAEFLTSQQIELVKPPTLNPRYSIYHLFLRDPDNHLVEIQQFRDPAWPRVQLSGDFGGDPGSNMTSLKGADREKSAARSNMTLVKSEDRKMSTERAPEEYAEWEEWTCKALPDPSGSFEESEWWNSYPGAVAQHNHIVSGRAVLTLPSGAKVVLEEHDLVVFRKGFRCTWEVTADMSRRVAFFREDATKVT